MPGWLAKADAHPGRPAVPQDATAEAEADVEASPPGDASRALPWRRRVASWPDAWRERWGRRANALEDRGLAWREAEERAFDEVLREKREKAKAAASPA